MLQWRKVMSPKATLEKIEAASKLLGSQSTTQEKFEAICKLLKGVSPALDKKLDACQKAISAVRKVQKGDLIELSADVLPENTEEEKRKKRTLLAFIRLWKSLQSEVERIKSEIELLQEKDTSSQEKISSASRIIGAAKGVFGLITIAAIIIAASQILMSRRESVQQSVQPPVVEEKIIQEQVTADDSVLSYWVKEGKLELDSSGRQLIWSIHVHKENAEIRQKGQDIPATNAQVKAELRNQDSSTPLSGTVGSDGWVRWTQPIPKSATSLYITGIQGELPWAVSNQNAWKNRPAASYSSS